MSEDEGLTALPEPIRERVLRLQDEVDQIVSRAQLLLTAQLPGPVSFRFVNAAPRDVLTPYERAQSISFVTRYEHLPSEYTVEVVEYEGQFYIGNMAFLRHALNEFRPLIQNQSDSVYYQNIHRVWYSMLTLDDPSQGTTIRVSDTDKRDVTPTYIRWLSEHNEAITFVLRPLDYGYLYNGILQHSDTVYSPRLLQDYTSGEFNYILWKHVLVLAFIRQMLLPYYRLIRILTFPRLGPL